MKDQKTVSNEFHELEYVAKKFNLPVWQVMKAKEDLSTSDRFKVYEHLQGVKSLQEAKAGRDQNKTPLTFVIEFGGHIRAQVVIVNNTPEVTMCVNGYGDRLPVSEVIIKDVTGEVKS
jgi:hypothetical protein